MRTEPTHERHRIPGSALLVRLVDDPADACRALADEVAQLARAEPQLVLGLATGNTPIGFYEELVRLHSAGELELARATSFNLDEYCGLPPEHPASFHAYMRTHLFDRAPLAATHIPDGMVPADQVEAHCQAYEAAIQAAGGVDWQLLGLGRNGHLAFNEPGSPRDARTRRIELSEETRRANAGDFPAGEAVPTHALSMGVATILAARRLRVLAFGAHKSAIVRRALTATPGPELPASWLREHDDVELWLDRPAAAELDGLLDRGARA
jgi:glucosamine-6-phosphate deaminase